MIRKIPTLHVYEIHFKYQQLLQYIDHQSINIQGYK